MGESAGAVQAPKKWITVRERWARQRPRDCSDEEVDECSRAVGSTEMQRSDSVATLLTCVSGDPDVADARAMDAAPSDLGFSSGGDEP